MNYRHAFHAGNWCDVMKHALLVAAVRAMQRKPGGMLLLDTHAGAGAYDLGGDVALRTGEWQSGVLLVREQAPASLADYLALTQGALSYPGSPLLLARLARPQDRLVCCELHPEEHAALRRTVGNAHRRDGHEAVRAFLPPPERRALTLIDPPYETPDEFSRVTESLREGTRRFPSGVFAAWYPVKGLARARGFLADIALGGPRDAIACEFFSYDADDAARLSGCGLLVVNPPYGFEAEAAGILRTLLPILRQGEGASVAVRRVTDE